VFKKTQRLRVAQLKLISLFKTTGITISTSEGPLLFLTVNMPTEYNDDDCLEKYTDVCTHLNAIITDSCTPHVIVAGDFNCQPGSRLYGVLSHLINDNNLVVTDLSLLSVNIVTHLHTVVILEPTLLGLIMLYAAMQWTIPSQT